MSAPLIHDYIGLSEASSMERNSDKTSSSSTEDEKNGVINFKETELRLGLPGSQSPERKGGVGVSVFSEENKTNGNGYFLNPLKNFVSGAKRGFSDTIDGSGKWALSLNTGSEADLGKKGLESKNTEHGPNMKDVLPYPLKHVQEKKAQVSSSSAAKAQVVGWPPIQSFRKNIMATNSTKNFDDDDDEKSGSGCLYVKVSMDGAPYLRKIDLVTYSNYIELSSALEKMFSCFTIGQCSSQGLPGREGFSESHIMDLLHGSEYVLTYEDKDGDWMLVGDVPWQMFANSCRRLRIMKGSEAIGLAPRAMEKCKNRN